MNIKKTLSALMVGAMVLSAAPVLPASASFVSTAYAAKGGAKMSIPEIGSGAEGSGRRCDEQWKYEQVCLGQWLVVCAVQGRQEPREECTGRKCEVECGRR